MDFSPVSQLIEFEEIPLNFQILLKKVLKDLKEFFEDNYSKTRDNGRLEDSKCRNLSDLITQMELDVDLYKGFTHQEINIEKSLCSEVNDLEKQKQIFINIQKFNEDKGVTIVTCCELNGDGIYLYIAPNVSQEDLENIKTQVQMIMPNEILKVCICSDGPVYQPSIDPGSFIKQSPSVDCNNKQTLGMFVTVNNEICVLTTGHNVQQDAIFYVNREAFTKVVDVIQTDELDLSISKLLNPLQIPGISNIIRKEGIQYPMYHFHDHVNFRNRFLKTKYFIELFRNSDHLEKIPATLNLVSFKEPISQKYITRYFIKCTNGAITSLGDSGLIVSTSPVEEREDVFGILMITGLYQPPNDNISYSCGQLLTDVFKFLNTKEEYRSLKIFTS